jgi:hypothetical protein
MHLQIIEGNPLDAEDIAMFEMFEREAWPDERCHEYVMARARAGKKIKEAVLGVNRFGLNQHRRNYHRRPEARASSAFTRVFDALWRASKGDGPAIAPSGPCILRGSPLRASASG